MRVIRQKEETNGPSLTLNRSTRGSLHSPHIEAQDPKPLKSTNLKISPLAPPHRPFLPGSGPQVYLVVQRGSAGAAAHLQGLGSAGGHSRWDGGQGLRFGTEFWVLGGKPLIATFKRERRWG